MARPDAYSQRQLGRLVDAAGRVGIGVVPIVNLLGHTQYLIKVPELRDLNELRAPDGSALPVGQVCPLHPRLLTVADQLIGDVARFCTAGKVHVGLDESFSLGRHPRSRAEIAAIGLAAHFAGHVSRLQQVAAGRQLRMGLWADMLALLPEVIPLLPAGLIAYDWYYYPFTRRPRLELRGFTEYDLVPALRARGIDYWGCPMNGSFRHEPLPVFGERLANLRDWWRRCQAVGAAGYLVTSWEPSRLAVDLTTTVDAAAASLWLEPQVEDDVALLAAGFARNGHPRHARDWARLALAADGHAFVGNTRWELNDHWDGAPLRQGITRFEAERAFYRRLVHRTPPLPRPFRASAAFRLYLAERDVFVRTAAALVLALRRRLQRGGEHDRRLVRQLAAFRRHTREFGIVVAHGRVAARALWALTRSRRVQGPNERIVAADEGRRQALLRWIAAAEERPERVRTAAPVVGAWQLRFDVIVEQPAWQQVAVLAPDFAGQWLLLRRRTTIEFRADAARPRVRLRREFSVPVPGPETPLRIAVRGIGQVVIAAVELTDGVTRRRPHGWPAARRQALGQPPPAAGWPDLDWGRDQDGVTLDFGQKKRRSR